jgi:hypothetical protein
MHVKDIHQRERQQRKDLLAVTATRQGAHGHHQSTGKKREREIKRSANMTVKVASHLHTNLKKKKK